MVPAWGDEFDMRLYFACIHPRQYELKNSDEYGLAKQLLAPAIAFGIGHLGIYRSALRTAPKSDVLRAVVKCLRCARQIGQPSYSDWYTTNQPGFAGNSPVGWFRARNQPELADLLRLKMRVEEADVFTDVPLKEGVGSQSNISNETGRRKLIATPAETQASALLAIFGIDFNEDEFDLRPYFARWAPSNYPLGSRRNFQLAQEIFDGMCGEFVGWITIYKAGLLAGSQIDGAIEGAVRCAMKAVELGLAAYLEWFQTPQPEFFGCSPKRWLEDRQLTELCSLLQGSR